MKLQPMDDPGKGGADFSKVVRGADGKPECVDHGAMNRVSEAQNPSTWRCIATSGAKFNPCRAACAAYRGESE